MVPSMFTEDIFPYEALCDSALEPAAKAIAIAAITINVLVFFIFRPLLFRI